MGPLGSSISTALLLKDIQHKPLVFGATPNPVSDEDSTALLALIKTKLDPVPSWLQGKERMASCAGNNSMFKLCCRILSHTSKSEYSSFTLQQAEQALGACLNRTDAQLHVHDDYPNSDGAHLIVPKLCLLVAVMQHAQIHSVETVQCVGSCAGLLCDPRHWPQH